MATKGPHKFLLHDGNYVHGTSASESGIMTGAARVLAGKRGYRDVDEVGVYQLIKVVRRKIAPIEIEEIACCSPQPIVQAKAKAKPAKEA